MFGAEAIPPGAFGRPPPTYPPAPASPLAPPKGGATLPATLQKLKGCMCFFLRNFEGLQVVLRRPSRAPKGLESFLFLSGKGTRIWPLAQALRTQDPPPVRSAQGCGIYPLSQAPIALFASAKGLKVSPLSQVPHGLKSVPLPNRCSRAPCSPYTFVHTQLSSLSEYVCAWVFQ